jgi:hypothetical protein
MIWIGNKHAYYIAKSNILVCVYFQTMRVFKAFSLCPVRYAKKKSR